MLRWLGLLLVACSTAAGAAEWRTGFDAGERDLAAWDTQGRWAVRDAALEAEAAGTASAVCYTLPVGQSLRAEATLTVLRRAAPGGWAAAGLCAWEDEGNYWRLALVEAPAGTRYAELVEMRGGTWQAQTGDGLQPTQAEGKALQWRDGQPYRLTLALSEEGVEGTILDPQSGKALTRLSYRFGGHPAVRCGRLGFHQTRVAARWDDAAVAVTLAAPAAQVEVRRGPVGAAALLDEAELGVSPELAKAWLAMLRDLSYGVTTLSPELAARPGVLSPALFDLLVVPDLQPRPEGLAEAVHEFLVAGGKAMLCGGPAFSHNFWKVKDKWLDEEGYRAALQNVPGLHPLLTFDGEAAALWAAAGNDPGSTPRASFDATQAHKGKALRLDFPDLAGWGNCSRTFTAPFPPGHSLTVLWLKGAPETTEMILEWAEKDGARWIATLAISAEWKRYVLTPEDFRYWHDSKSEGRGGPGDRLRPEAAAVLRIGLAESHCHDLPKGRHTLWADELATAAAPVERPPAFASRPVVELVCPPYKTFAIRDAATVRSTPIPGEAIAGIQPPARCFSPVARFEGRGLDRSAKLRWLPCLDALDARETVRGAPLSILVHWRAPFYRAAWAYLGTAEPAFLAQPPVRKALSAAIRRMARGVFLVEGGATEFVYARGEPVVVGARVANFGKEPFRGRVAVEVISPANERVASETFDVAVEPGAVARVAREVRLAPADGLFALSATLAEGDRELDRIVHSLQFAPDLSGEEFVKARDGDFWLGGKRWFPVGINYWPRYCAGLEPHEYGAHWLNPAYYDPELVDEDLARLAQFGATMLSAATWSADEGRTLNDFLLRCRRHGLRVNLFVGGLDPLNGGPEPGLKTIRDFGLARSPIVFAYDIAWEPRFYGRGDWPHSWGRFDAAWRQWLLDQYGSVEAAEAQWGCPAPREDGEVVTPSTEQFRGQGGRARMVAAFHRFFYDHVGERYAQAIRRIRQAAPNHLVGFRGQAHAVPSCQGLWPIHSPGAMKATDFTSPEGYGLMAHGAGRKTPWRDLRRGGLTTLYLRAASGGKPVFWAEYGAVLYPNGTAWSDALLDLPEERYAYQTDELADWARMLGESGANGAAPWWFPGGFRTNEGSDWGLFDPDGMPRPCCAALADTARRIAQPRREPQDWIEFDLDAHVFDSWPHYSDRYLAILEAGKAPGVRLAGAARSSADCPDLAVGGVPWRGVGPATYLNAMFEEARIERGAKPTLTVVVANTGEAEWLDAASAVGKAGAVELVVQAGPMTKAVPIGRRVPRLTEIEIGPIALEGLAAGEVRLRMRAAGRGEFGTVCRVALPAATE